MINEQEMMRMHIEALFTLNHDLKLMNINEPWDNTKPAPKFVMGRTFQGDILYYFRNDISDDIIHKVSELCLKEPAIQNTNERPRYFEQYLECFDNGHYTEEVCFYVPEGGEKIRECILLDSKNVSKFTSGGFEWLKEEFPSSLPCAALIQADQAVSICRSVRISCKAQEAGIETLESFQGNGYAHDVLIKWAQEVRLLGCEPLYSTFSDNFKSQRVAQKANLYCFGTGFKIL
ncbi:GNAT family N-acetyltransferase [Anaerocolumna sedimenticola]|uniref:GNAT family N-acetyltransferase n=1 Tax=Anaerocolumna sedimenticola TaxID=2696063 RepID=A0A6P1TL09_9FIRM|nr:GNAT family N-acetyltransferase [Anaerocolumna sedimenticola]QHQ60977.1 GNAT family N-acetyltransferase [Anaerocolumna sedimenticola]